MRILYCGTPRFAAVSLEALALSSYGKNVVGVLTRADKPKGRGHMPAKSDVKLTAEKYGYPVFCPETLRGDAFSETLGSLSPDIIIVAAYGKIFPEYMLSYPRFGCINLHGSVLPEYRGAAPIQRAVMDGKSSLGVTVMKMAAGIDTGDTLMSRSVVMPCDENFGYIYEKLSTLASELLLEALPLIESGSAVFYPQDESAATYAPKIEKEDCRLNLDGNALTEHNRVRALSPLPLVFTTLRGKAVKITAASYRDGAASGAPGTVDSLVSKGDGEIVVNLGSGRLSLLRLIPEGKKEMSAGDFIRGRGITSDDVFV